MTVTVVRTITLTYPDFETYVEDRKLWYLPSAGTGTFGPKKKWHHSILSITSDDMEV